MSCILSLYGKYIADGDFKQPQSLKIFRGKDLFWKPCILHEDEPWVAEKDWPAWVFIHTIDCLKPPLLFFKLKICLSYFYCVSYCSFAISFQSLSPLKLLSLHFLALTGWRNAEIGQKITSFKMSPTQPKAVCMRNLARKSVLILFPAGLHPVPKVLANGVRKVSRYGHLFDLSLWILDCEYNQH